MPTNTYLIDARDDWKGLFDLYKGQTATLTAAGRWKWDQSGRDCGPGGNGQPAPGGCPTAGAQGSLIWRVTQPLHAQDPNDPVSGVGGMLYKTYFSFDAQSYVINIWGNYEFRMNDDNLGDNSGSLTITVDLK